MDLHQWIFELEVWRKQQGQEGGEVNASNAVVQEVQSNVGVTVMVGTCSGAPGPWSEDPAWNGWWGNNLPFETPVFVLTHHPRTPLEMEGGTHGGHHQPAAWNVVRHARPEDELPASRDARRT